MGIDPIGKSGAPGSIAPPSANDVGSVDGPEEFSLDRVEESSSVEATSPLDQLRAGNIDVNGYLDLRVEQATAHLANRIDGNQLEFIRSSLRAQLEQDPVLVDLVRRATSSVSGSMNRG